MHIFSIYQSVKLPSFLGFKNERASMRLFVLFWNAATDMHM